MKEELIKEILQIEWDMFTKVHNEGGVAPCQENQKTFVIMRMSQALSWSESMLNSYLRDLTSAKELGRNLMTEKYALMMKYTSPSEYDHFADKLPVLSPEATVLVNGITLLMVQWAKELKSKYPHVVNAGRPIDSTGDTPRITSLETYTRGELSTYSLDTLRLSWGYFSKCLTVGLNHYEEVLNNTSKFYGYDSIAEADRGLTDSSHFAL